MPSVFKTESTPDIIHAHSGLSSGIFANFLSEYFNCPFVITEHSPLMFHFVSKARGELVIESFKRARFVASLTIFQESLLKRVCSEAKSQIIPNVINEDIFHIKRKTCGDFPFTIISVLYPSPVKGGRYLFNSFRILKEKGVKFKFLIVGEGIEKMKKECELLGIKDDGEFYFNLNKEELSSLYNKSHLYCCSSIYETFGLAAREAMLCGLPVVTTDNGGVVDSVTENTGLIVPVQDSNALAEAIVSIRDNYDDYDPNTIRI
ncbi:glycosyltransferase [Algoriphagus hitonicola]|uniref:glycosyltransferase n=1 Tax=Algoriphagus hitonicola TaxID=435880 RepID=UPI00361FE768